MVSTDFHCKENDGTTGAAHLIQTFSDTSPDIRRVRGLLNHRSLVFREKKAIKWAAPIVSSFFFYNENPTRALNTTSLKWCLPSTNAIDRREKIIVCV